jgi:pyruvate oxidase
MTATSTSPGSDWHRAVGVDEVPDGGVKVCTLAGRTIALIRQGNRYGALDNRCPHMGGPLGEGVVEYGLLVCPWHGRGYDPMTGECDGFAERATAFPVAVRDDGVYVEIRSSSAV